jgi:ACS family hexuronate transporter-like MFS transporter
LKSVIYLHLSLGPVPAPGVGSVVGMLISKVVGYLLQWTGSYVPVFIIAASAYLVALAIVHLLAPKLEPAD